MNDKFVTLAERERFLRFLGAFMGVRNTIAVSVPRAMVDGPVGPEGWVPWKPVDSPVTRDEVLKLEAEIGGRFPGLFRAYLTEKCLLMTEMGSVLFPETPVDDPLGGLRAKLDLLEESPFYQQERLVPFAYDANGAGLVCFDLTRQAEDGECPVVVVDAYLCGQDGYRGAELTPSFGALLDRIEADFQAFSDSTS